jgi:hypothetical protein
VRGTFNVDEPTGDRWNLALEVLTSGEAFVAIGERLLVYRDANGPTATGEVQVEIRSSTHGLPNAARAAEDVAAGMAQLQTLLNDDRLAQLVSEYGLAIAYVSDYDTGRVTLASVDRGGAVSWVHEPE